VAVAVDDVAFAAAVGAALAGGRRRGRRGGLDRKPGVGHGHGRSGAGLLLVDRGGLGREASEECEE
jgi:hypothetical protein